MSGIVEMLKAFLPAVPFPTRGLRLDAGSISNQTRVETQLTEMQSPHKQHKHQTKKGKL
jgi:hypothetical protein